MIQKAVRHADGMDMDKCQRTPEDKCGKLMQEIMQAQKPKKTPFYDSAKDRCPGQCKGKSKSNSHMIESWLPIFLTNEVPEFILYF